MGKHRLIHDPERDAWKGDGNKPIAMLRNRAEAPKSPVRYLALPLKGSPLGDFARLSGRG